MSIDDALKEAAIEYRRERDKKRLSHQSRFFCHHGLAPKAMRRGCKSSSLHRRGDRKMSFMDIVTNVVTGGAYGALTGNWGPETRATAPPPSTPSPTGNFGIFRPVSPPPREATCCDRYRFNDGFLVDGVTGLACSTNRRRFLLKCRVSLRRKNYP